METDQPPPSVVLPGVKNVVIVLSGKGGVGKSTVACQLALSIAHRGGGPAAATAATAAAPPPRVGILDVDICGPSVPKICGVEGRSVTQGPDGLVPVELFAVSAPVAAAAPTTDSAPITEASSCDPPPAAPTSEAEMRSLKVMSIAFLLPNATDAVVWRGPRKVMMINQFITGVDWGELDYLIIDTPPGTSDEHMALCGALKGLHPPAGAVVVTTPQKVSTDDVRKELSFCHKLSLRCLGIVENMSGFICPHCADCTDIFSRGGGEELARMYEVPFLGRIPIDPALSLSQDMGAAVAAVGEDGRLAPSAAAIAEVVDNIMVQVTRSALHDAGAAATALKETTEGKEGNET